MQCHKFYLQDTHEMEVASLVRHESEINTADLDSLEMIDMTNSDVMTNTKESHQGSTQSQQDKLLTVTFNFDPNKPNQGLQKANQGLQNVQSQVNKPVYARKSMPKNEENEEKE